MTTILGFLQSVLGFILVLGPLIFIHELGHFLLAKFCGVRVLKFSLGFGPKLFGKVVGETEYVVSAFPLGGFVKMFGENPDEQQIADEEKAVSFVHKTVWQRFLIVLAGPIFNLLFSIVLLFLVFATMGTPTAMDTTRIGRVLENSPAASVGLQVDDVILSINSHETLGWMDVLQAVKNSDGKPIQVKVLRGSQKHTLEVVPKLDSAKNMFGEEIEKRFMIGMMAATEIEYVETSIPVAIKNACLKTWSFVTLIKKTLEKIVQRVVPASELGGPILIAQIAGDQLKSGGIEVIFFMCLLSVNLGILNLLPIPVLDGGHLLFLTIEAVRRKPMDERAQIIAQQVGIAFLASLMVFVFYNDLVRLTH